MSARTTCLFAIAAASMLAAPALAQPGRPPIGRGAQPPPIAQPPAPTPTASAPAVAPPDSQPQATAQPATAQPAARTAPGAPMPQPAATPPAAAPTPQPVATPPAAAPGRAAPQPVSAAAPGRAAPQPVPTPAPDRAGPEPVAAPAPGRGAPQPVAVPGRGAPSPVVATPGRATRRPLVADDPGFRILRRDPIEFRPFALSDVGSGATAERQLTLPNGKSLTVGAYLSEINAIQARLNEIGYSLEDLGDTPETATVIEEPVVTGQQLTTQKGSIASAHARSGGALAVEQAFRSSITRSEQAIATTLKGRGSLTQALAGKVGGATVPGAAGVQKRWGQPIGDPNSVWVSLDGEFLMDGTAEGTTLTVTQRARGSLLNQDIEFLAMTGELRSPISEAMKASLEFRVLGNTISVLNENPNAGWTSEGLNDHPLVWADLNPLSVAGVPMQVEFNLHGEAGVQYWVGVYPGSANGIVVPFVNASASADIKAIDAYVLEAGVSGELLVLDDRLVVAGSVSLQYDNETAAPYVYYDYLAVNDFLALQGDLNVYVCAYVVSNWQPKKKCWRKYLWKEDGIDLHDELFSGSERVYLD